MKTNRNGFLTEDGLVAFYRDFGRLGDDLEAAGVRFKQQQHKIRHGLGDFTNLVWLRHERRRRLQFATVTLTRVTDTLASTAGGTERRALSGCASRMGVRRTLRFASFLPGVLRHQVPRDRSTKVRSPPVRMCAFLLLAPTTYNSNNNNNKNNHNNDTNKKHRTGPSRSRSALSTHSWG